MPSLLEVAEVLFAISTNCKVGKSECEEEEGNCTTARELQVP